MKKQEKRKIWNETQLTGRKNQSRQKKPHWELREINVFSSIFFNFILLGKNTLNNTIDYSLIYAFISPNRLFAIQ